MASTKTKIKKNWLQTILVEGRQHLENPGFDPDVRHSFLRAWSAGHPPWSPSICVRKRGGGFL